MSTASAPSNKDAVEAVAQEEGPFHAHKPRTAPANVEGTWHKPGVQASPHDAIPTATATVLPAGSAPPESTFRPNANNEAPALSDDAARTSASDTLGGATSADVHTGLGHPGQGQSSSELRDGSTKGAGLVGVGASGAPAHANQVDARDPGFADQRGLDRDDAAGRTDGPKGGARGDGSGSANAEERVPGSADAVAAEAPSGK